MYVGEIGKYITSSEDNTQFLALPVKCGGFMTLSCFQRQQKLTMVTLLKSYVTIVGHIALFLGEILRTSIISTLIAIHSLYSSYQNFLFSFFFLISEADDSFILIRIDVNLRIMIPCVY